MREKIRSKIKKSKEAPLGFSPRLFKSSELIRALPILGLILWAIISFYWVFNARYSVSETFIVEGWLLKHGFFIYRDYIHQHTPMLRFILFPFFEAFGYRPFTLQVYSALHASFLAVFLFLVARRFSETVARVSLILFCILFFPLFNNTYLEELSVSLFILIAIYFFFIFLDGKKQHAVFLSGVFIGLAIMTKQTSSLSLIALLVMICFLLYKKFISFREFEKTLFFYIAGVAVIFLPILLWVYYLGALKDFFYYNFIFNITVYRKVVPYNLQEGMSIFLPLSLFVIPIFILIYKKAIRDIKDRYKIYTLLVLLFFLLSELLPTYTVPRILVLFPLMIINWAIIISFLFNSKKHLISKNIQLVLLVFLLVFAFGEYKRVKNFVAVIPSELSQKTLLVSYTKNDIRVGEWIKENTLPSERIYNMGNFYILFLSQRLPQNKYIFMTPWIVTPYDESTAVLVSNPPKIIISDVSNEKDPALKGWKFLDYMHEKYYIKKQFESIRIYYKK